MLYSSDSGSGPPSTTILGIGNWLLGDEGVGIHVVTALKGQLDNYCNVTLVDGGTCLDSLLLLDDTDRLLIVDAVRGGLPPGTIYRLLAAEIDYSKSSPVSLHEWSAADSLRAMELLGKAPRETVVIGIEPAEIRLSTELSQPVRKSIPEVIRLILKEIQANRKAGRN